MTDGADRPADLRDLADDGECREVLEEVWLYLDGEVGPGERSVIELHLGDCEPCLRKYGLEGVVKALVARCCGQEDTPASLRERVLTSLREVSVAPDGHSVRVSTVEVSSGEVSAVTVSTTTTTTTIVSEDDR